MLYESQKKREIHGHSSSNVFINLPVLSFFGDFQETSMLRIGPGKEAAAPRLAVNRWQVIKGSFKGLTRAEIQQEIPTKIALN